jgi:tRNA pseudouridine65 synthase
LSTQPTLPLPLLYQSPELVAINKPHGLLVHRSPIASDAHEFAVQRLRDQLGQKVYPVHRLDRKTGGVLLFALTETMNSAMQVLFAEGKVQKKYLAVVRGYTPDTLEIDYPLRRDDGLVQEAFTHLKTIAWAEVPIASAQHPTSRYSLVELYPTTGRMHQLRKHMAHVLHPIIGDRPHGCNKQNKLVKEHWGLTTMLLHAQQAEFGHPTTGEPVVVTAPLQADFTSVMKVLFPEK